MAELGAYLKSINLTKEDVMLSEADEHEYNPYIINKLLSYHPDCLLYVNEMNERASLPSRMQYDYYRAVLTKRSRFSKMIKPEVDEKVKLVADFLNCSYQKATKAMRFYSATDLKRMAASLDTGGSSKKRKSNGSI